MTTFAKSTFNAAGYAAFRPTYPPALYNTVLRYHQGPKNLCVDLGTGTGTATRSLASSFKEIIGTDPSDGMIKKAQDSTPSSDYPNVSFEVSSAESLPFLTDESVDIVVAAQAAHWFDYPRLFPELHRVLRPRGTIAFWGYKDPIFPSYPKASQILDEWSYGPDPHTQLGRYWEPGRSILRQKLRPIRPPEDLFTDEERIEYEPSTVKGKGMGEGTLFVKKTMTLKQAIGYLRTFSSFHSWAAAHPEQVPRAEGGKGDTVDRVVDEMKEAEGWNEGDMLIDVEWGSGLLMCRRK